MVRFFEKAARKGGCENVLTWTGFRAMIIKFQINGKSILNFKEMFGLLKYADDKFLNDAVLILFIYETDKSIKSFN